MPVYTYRREDGTIFEVKQRITDNALTVDKETGQKVTRIIVSPKAVIFKTDGFYITDSVKSNINNVLSNND